MTDLFDKDNVDFQDTIRRLFNQDNDIEEDEDEDNTMSPSYFEDQEQDQDYENDNNMNHGNPQIRHNLMPPSTNLPPSDAVNMLRFAVPKPFKSDKKVFERTEYDTNTGEIVKAISIVKKVTNVEHFVQTSLSKALPKALPKIKAPKIVRDSVITTTAENERNPFLQKLTKPDLITLFKCVNIILNIINMLQNIFSCFIITNDFPFFHRYDPSSNFIDYALVVSC
jgi:hypothetical protein